MLRHHARPRMVFVSIPVSNRASTEMQAGNDWYLDVQADQTTWFDMTPEVNDTQQHIEGGSLRFTTRQHAAWQQQAHCHHGSILHMLDKGSNIWCCDFAVRYMGRYEPDGQSVWLCQCISGQMCSVGTPQQDIYVARYVALMRGAHDAIARNLAGKPSMMYVSTDRMWTATPW